MKKNQKEKTEYISKAEYISLSIAAKKSGYAQNYLNLLCRQGKLKGKKIGRNWVTTYQWLDEYQQNLISNMVLEKNSVTSKKDFEEIENIEKDIGRKNDIFKKIKIPKIPKLVFATSLFFLILLGGFTYAKNPHFFSNITRHLVSIQHQVSSEKDQIAYWMFDQMFEVKNNILQTLPQIPSIGDSGHSASEISPRVAGVSTEKILEIPELNSRVSKSSTLKKFIWETPIKITDTFVFAGKSLANGFNNFSNKVAGFFKSGFNNLSKKLANLFGDTYFGLTQLFVEQPGEKISQVPFSEKEGDDILIEKEKAGDDIYHRLQNDTGESDEIENLKEGIDILKQEIDELKKVSTGKIIQQNITQEIVREIIKEQKGEPGPAGPQGLTGATGSPGLSGTGTTIVQGGDAYLSGGNTWTGGNVFESHSLMNSLGVSHNTSVGGDLSVGGTTTLGTKATDALNVQASSNFFSPLTVTSSITQSSGQVSFGGNVDATSGLDVTGADLTVGGTNFVVDNTTGDLTIAGDLTVAGSQTYSGAASFTANSASAALLVNQQGTGNIVLFQDNGVDAFVVADGGNVGIGDTTPHRKLSVAGDAVIENNLISTQDNGIYFGRTGLSENQWAVYSPGNTWTAKDSDRPWTDIAMSSNGKYQTAVTYGDDIYISSDFGNTWTVKDDIDRDWWDIAMSSDGKYQTAVVGGGDIYISSDFGNTWTVKDDTNRWWWGIAMSSDGKYQTATEDSGDIYISSDFGNTWTVKDDTDRWWYGIAMSSDGKYQTAAAANVGIYISTDYGNSWTIINNTNKYWWSLAMSSDGKYQTAVTYFDAIYISSDFGSTWTAKDSSRDWHGIAMSSNGKYQTAVVYDGDIYISSDFGNTWTVKDDTDRWWYGIAMSSDGKYQTAVVISGKIYVSVADSITYGNIGIGVIDPDTKLEIYNDGDQLKLSFDGTDNTTFAVDTNGDLTITASGDEIKFGAENLSTTGTLGAGATTVTSLTNSGNIIFDLTNDVTIQATDPAGIRTYTIPDFGLNDSFVGVAATQTLTNKTLTTPMFADLGYIVDANGNEMLIFDTTASAVNELTLTNAATGNPPTLTVSGDDTNIDFDITPKGTGGMRLTTGGFYQPVYGTDDGLVLDLPFNEGYYNTSSSKVYDRSRYGNDGTLYYGDASGDNDTYADMWDQDGKYGKALEFDGTNDYVDCGNDPSLDITDAITIEAWVKSDGVTGDEQTIVSRQNGATSGYYFLLPHNQSFLRFGYRGLDTPDINSTITITYGQWEHVVATWDNTTDTVKFYINGVEEIITGNTGTPVVPTLDLIIGSYTGNDEYFDGAIDGVKIYNRALSADEVKAHYLRGSEMHTDLALDTSSTAGELYGNRIILTDTGAVASGTDDSYGQQITVSRTGATGGIINTYGIHSSVTGDSGGDSTATAGYFSASGADNNYGLIVENGDVGIGTITPSAKLHSLATTEQLRLGYDTTSYLSVTGDATGRITFDAVDGIAGSDTGFLFQDAIYQPVYGTDDGLVLDLPFSEGYYNTSSATAYDRSRYGNDGTLYYGDASGDNDTYADMWDQDGKYGKALEFDGTNDYVEVNGVSNEIATGSFTVETWFMRTTVFDSGNSLDEFLFGLGDASSDNDIYFYLNASDGSLLIRASYTPNISCWTTQNSWTANTWYHVVATFDNVSDGAKIFVNGVQDGSTGDTGRSTTPVSVEAYIGQKYNGTLFFDGTMDEVKIYNRALDADEVKAHYLRGSETHTDLALDTSSTAGELYGNRIILTDTGAVSSGADTSYGQHIAVTRTGASSTADIDTYGIHSTVTGDTGGTNSAAIAGYFSATGADYNYGLIVEAGKAGFGTTAPVAKLDIVASESNLLSLGSANTATWSKIGGDGANSSWNTNYELVCSMTTFNGKLYAGLGSGSGDAEVWEYNGSSWTQIGGDGTGWGSTYEYVQSLTTFNGKLYAGVSGADAGEAELWEYNGSLWTQIGGDGISSSWDTDYERVSSLTTFNGKLYAGLGKDITEAEVWEYDNSSWTKIGGDGTSSSWNTNYERVYSLTTFNGKLYAGLGNGEGDAEVWEYDGSSWTQIGGDGTGWGSTYEYIRSLTTFNGKLYAGVSGADAGEAELWEYDGSSWTKIGGDGTGWADSTYEFIRSLTTFNGKLYAGVSGASAGEAELWEYDGSSWTKIGGDGTGSSWDTDYEVVSSLTTFNGKLYAGLGNEITEAEVWEYDGSSWTTFARNGVGLSIGDYMYMGRNGYVGIGNPEPESALDIRGDLTVSSSLLVTHAGNVGIGTATPSSLLEVNQGGTGNIADFKSGASSILTVQDADRLKMRDKTLFTLGDINEGIIDDMEAVSDWSVTEVAGSGETVAAVESTIVKVNDGSMKITTTSSGSSEGDVIKKTFSSNQDYSVNDRIGFWVRASATGQIFTIKISDTVAADSTHTVTIDTANTWYYEEWDISGIATASRDVVDYIEFYIDEDKDAPTIYIDQLRYYDKDNRAGEMFVDGDGHLVLAGEQGIELQANITSSLPAMSIDSAIVEVNQPFAVNVAGDTGINYDLAFLNTGSTFITSQGPLTIAAGDPNHSENLTITTQSNLAGGDSGRATGGGATTLDDSTKSSTWTADEWIGGTISIVSGTGASQTQLITDNTTTQITVADWDTTLGDPATNSYYTLNYARGGDVLVQVGQSHLQIGGFKILGADSSSYVFKVAPDGDVEIGGSGLGGSDLLVKQNISLTGGNITIGQLDANDAGTITTAVGADTGGACLDASTYYYVIVAVNDNGTTAYDGVSAGLSPGAGDNDKIQVTWDPVDGVTGYKLYRDTDTDWADGADYLVDAKVISALDTTYTDDCVLAGDTASQTPPTENTTGGNLYVGGEHETNIAKHSCPTGWVLVPGSSTFGTKDFCVMKYEAKKDGTTKNPSSVAAGTPWVTVSWYEAKNACKRVGAHLMTEAERMTINRNVEAVAGNWTLGVVGSGYLFAGHNDNAPSAAKAASTTDTGDYRCAYTDAAGTDESPNPCPTNTAAGTSGTTQHQVRILTLSNSEVIWDLAGNVWEWTDAQCDTTSWHNGGTFEEWNDADLTDYEQIVGGSTSYTSTNGVGEFYGCSANANAFIRGGSWNVTSIAGVFALVLSKSPASSSSTDVGFRCSR